MACSGLVLASVGITGGNNRGELEAKENYLRVGNNYYQVHKGNSVLLFCFVKLLVKICSLRYKLFCSC